MNKFGGKVYLLIGAGLIIVIAIVAVYLIRPTYIFGGSLNYDNIVATSRQTPVNEVNDDQMGHALPVSIDATSNFQDYSVKFEISKDTSIQIHAVGEAADYASNPYLFNSHDNDGVEVYFDLNNDKSSSFDVNKDDRQYRILWKSLQMDGQNIDKRGVKVKQMDPDFNTYNMEITFPWKTLGFVVPKPDTEIGFDIALMDNDSGSMKALYFWNTKNDFAWRNTSSYGTLILKTQQQSKRDSDVVIATKHKSEGFTSTSTPFRFTGIGDVKDAFDLSGTFQAEWDQDNLYLKVKVTDNIKRLASALFDYGWIEDLRGNVVWKMNENNLTGAGGALKNKKIDTLIKIRKGTYWLKYHTDESHSPDKWDDAPPQTSFYGIKLSYK